MSEKNDTAGKILGWSLGAGLDKKGHDELIKVPCTFSFKVIGDAAPNFEKELTETIERKISRKLEPSSIDRKNSSKGKYVSITFRVHVESIQEIYEIYALLKAHPSTKTVL